MMRQPIRQMLSILLLTLLACLHSAAQVADRISGQIDGSATAVLRGNVHPRTRTHYDLGQTPSNRELGYMTISLKPSSKQQMDLQKLLAEQQDRSSARYHKWITPEGYANRFGLSQNDIRKITSWLRSQGFRILSVARGRNFVSFSGTAGQAERTFHVQIHDYQTDGEIHFANVGEPSIPVSLDGLVGGIRGLNDFPIKAGASVHKVSGGVRSNYTFGPGGPNIITPDDVATIYDLTSLIYGGYGGSGQTVVIVGESDINLADIQAFRSIFQLSSMSIQSYIVGTDPGHTAAEEEADIDLEWAGAVARDANFVYVASQDVFSAATYGIDQNLGSVVSMSFGECEAHDAPSAMSAFQTEVQKANSMGITVLASSGDTGAAGCEHNPSLGKVASTPIGVQFPASIPEVTAVGGTEFIPNDSSYWGINGLLFNSALSYIPEIGWNDTADPLVVSIASSGGGASSCATQDASGNCTGGFAKPAWQTGPGVPSDGVRDVPDVAFDASQTHDGYWLCGPTQSWSCGGGFPPTGSYSTFGGTSVATPIFAGMLVMLNQYVVANGIQSAPGLGNINPDLYRYSQSFPSAFHDVTSGDNIVQCFLDPVNCPSGSYGYTARPGYDQVTGLGSIDGNMFFTNWALALPPPDFTVTSDVSSLTVLRGSSGQVTLTIAPENGFAQTVSLSCSISGLPSGTACSFNPSTITPGTSGTTVMTIQASSTSLSRMAQPKSALLCAFLISSMGLFGVILDWKRSPCKVRFLSLGLVLLVVILPSFACGGGGNPPPPPPPPPVIGTVTVTATGAGSVPIVHAMQITVTIQ